MIIVDFGFSALRRSASFPVALLLVCLIPAAPAIVWGQNTVSSQLLQPVEMSASTASPSAISLGQSPPASLLDQPPSASSLSPEDLGDLAMAHRHFQAALEAYRKVPVKSAATWNKIGIACQQMFLVQEAKKSYETSLKMDPRNPDVINNLGTVYYSQQQYGPAEKLYRKALKIRPRSALIYKNLGTDMLAGNKFKKGWDCYQTALAIDPDIFEKSNLMRIGEPTPTQKRGAMSYYLAKSYAQVGMTDLAVEYLRKAIDDGFTDRKKIMADKELASLRGLTAFEQLLAEQRRQ
jgi:tetratricopeptide (TPR) repeat protein